MSNEKALRSGTEADIQFSEFIEPEDAVIKVTVESDIRMVGKFSLTALIVRALRREGYGNVVVSEENVAMFGPGSIFENKELREVQKKVQIQIEVK